MVKVYYDLAELRDCEEVRAMEWTTEAKLIDFFKCEAPLRRQESLDKEASGNGRWSDDLKLEPPCGGSFWSGNGDGRSNGHHDFRLQIFI